eukprot:340801_1
MWEELTTTTTKLLRDYPYAIPAGKLIINLHDAIPPGIPEAEEVKEERVKATYSKTSNFMWPVVLAPFSWAPWLYQLYKLYKMENPCFSVSKREWIGLGIGLVGALIRNISKLWIGRSFAYFLSIRKDQKLITNGPYFFVRHPGYTGTVLLLCGDAIYWNNILSYGWALFFGLQLIPRIKEEEKMLQNEFGNQWDKYCQKTKAKIFPFIY